MTSLSIKFIRIYKTGAYPVYFHFSRFILFTPPLFYNTWMISESDGSSSNDNNAQFHFESWNEGTSDSNITND